MRAVLCTIVFWGGLVALEASQIQVRTKGKDAWIETWQRGDYQVEEAWAVLTDLEGLPRFMPHLDSSRVVDRTDSTWIVYQQGRNSLLLPWTFSLTLEFKQVPPERLEFRLLEGNVKRYEGVFTVRPHEAGVEMRYEAFSQHRIPLPNWLLRFILKRQMRGMMPAFFAEIERRRRATEEP